MAPRVDGVSREQQSLTQKPTRTQTLINPACRLIVKGRQVFSRARRCASSVHVPCASTFVQVGFGLVTEALAAAVSSSTDRASWRDVTAGSGHPRRRTGKSGGEKGKRERRGTGQRLCGVSHILGTLGHVQSTPSGQTGGSPFIRSAGTMQRPHTTTNAQP